MAFLKPNNVVLQTVAQFYDIGVGRMLGRVSFKESVRAREVCTWILREYKQLSYPHIGRLLHRDHSTIWTAYRRTKTRLREDEQFRGEVEFIERLLGIGTTEATALTETKVTLQ